MEIDFIITWVDMNDAEWQRDFVKYSNKTENEKNSVSKARFRDYGLLKFWFRGVEKFAPWVRKIHFVTCGQKPEWLDENHPKINLINHKNFIPEQFLPSYNSVVIERYLHKIPDLSEHFVYFNDDFYIINHLDKSRFFQNGLPCDISIFQYNPNWSQWYIRIKNNIRLINQHFDKKEVMSRFHDKWYNPIYGKKLWMNYVMKFYSKFITLRTPHNAQPFLKSMFEDVWKHCEKELTETSANRFRTVTDYTPELFRAWQMCTGNFTPYNTYSDTKMFALMVQPKQQKALQVIRDQSYKLICLNDNVRIRNYEQVIGNIKITFESILPEKSSFEKL